MQLGGQHEAVYSVIPLIWVKPNALFRLSLVHASLSLLFVSYRCVSTYSLFDLMD